MKSILKHIIKIKIATPLRSLFLTLRKAEPSRDGWDNRVLIINLEALGDLVIFTGVLKHYKKAYPDKEIYLLVKKGINLEPFLIPEIVDKILYIDYKQFAANPFYGWRKINELRKIGFSQVINHDFSAAEILGKIIGVSLAAPKSYVYAGMRFEQKNPFDIQQKKNLAFFRDNILPKYTNVIEAIAEPDKERLPHVLEHYKRIFESATGTMADDYMPYLPLNLQKQNEVLEKFDLNKGEYVVVNPNASVEYKKWPLNRFCRVIQGSIYRKLSEHIVLMGAEGERENNSELESICGEVNFRNLAGKTSLEELVYVISGAKLLLTNDTSAVHIAVATQIPSVCITGGGQFGMFCDYGLAINKWAYTWRDCFKDNWRCSSTVKKNKLAPCVDAVTLQQVSRTCEEFEKL